MRGQVTAGGASGSLVGGLGGRCEGHGPKSVAFVVGRSTGAERQLPTICPASFGGFVRKGRRHLGDLVPSWRGAERRLPAGAATAHLP
jgi:hypothetical protein